MLQWPSYSPNLCFFCHSWSSFIYSVHSLRGIQWGICLLPCFHTWQITNPLTKCFPPPFVFLFSSDSDCICLLDIFCWWHLKWKGFPLCGLGPLGEKIQAALTLHSARNMSASQQLLVHLCVKKNPEGLNLYCYCYFIFGLSKTVGASERHNGQVQHILTYA